MEISEIKLFYETSFVCGFTFAVIIQAFLTLLLSMFLFGYQRYNAILLVVILYSVVIIPVYLFSGSKNYAIELFYYTSTAVQTTIMCTYAPYCFSDVIKKSVRYYIYVNSAILGIIVFLRLLHLENTIDQILMYLFAVFGVILGIGENYIFAKILYVIKGGSTRTLGAKQRNIKRFTIVSIIAISYISGFGVVNNFRSGTALILWPISGVSGVFYAVTLDFVISLNKMLSEATVIWLTNAGMITMQK